MSTKCVRFSPSSSMALPEGSASAPSSPKSYYHSKVDCKLLSVVTGGAEHASPELPDANPPSAHNRNDDKHLRSRHTKRSVSLSPVLSFGCRSGSDPESPSCREGLSSSSFILDVGAESCNDKISTKRTSLQTVVRDLPKPLVLYFGFSGSFALWALWNHVRVLLFLHDASVFATELGFL